MAKRTRDRFYDRLFTNYEPKSIESKTDDERDEAQELNRDLRDFINRKRAKNLAFLRGDK